MLNTLLDVLPTSQPRVRLQKALGRSERASPLDLAVLVRHCLRYDDARHDSVQWHHLPATPPLPWADVGIEVLPLADGGCNLRALPWTPDWCGSIDPFAGACAEEQRRQTRTVSGDPFLHLLNFKDYRTEAQREAVRAAVLAPPGSTLLVHLPTGAGKSLCAHMLGLLQPEGDQRNLTVVIVPTDALNLDQERKIDRFLGHRCAYRGADSAGERRGFFSRIYGNQQRILFTSPEAFCQSLRGPLAFAASHGWIRALVVDEAHLVDTWGDAFRPEFQEIPGVRRQWLRDWPEGASAFATLLLSATLTPPCIKLLRKLFPAAPPGTFAEVRDPEVRPEPSFWFADCTSQEQREARLLEAVLHAPRPLLVYTSLKNARRPNEAPMGTAEDYFRLLKNRGFLRVELFDGNTKPNTRDRIVREWAEDSLDVVVATSAFGLGVDKDDVRAILHCCIPESLDRFYQEVGRGGRDGKACTSLVLHTDADSEVAKGLSRKRNITLKKGWARWERMMVRNDSAAAALTEERWRLNAALIPNYRNLKTGSSKKNVAWNVRTLLLMARAELIDLDAQAPDRPPEGLSEAERVAWWQGQKVAFDTRVIRLRPEFQQHFTEREFWEEKVNASRKESAAAARADLHHMLAALRAKRCITEYLAETYNDEEAGVWVGGQCGGCPHCRARRDRPLFRQPSPYRRTPWPEVMAVGASLAKELGERRALWLLYPPMDGQAPFRLLKWFVTNRGVNVLLEEHGAWTMNLAKNLGTWESGQRRFFVQRGVTGLFSTEPPFELTVQPWPTALVLAPGGPALKDQWGWLKELEDAAERFPIFVLAPEDARDPERQDRPLADVVAKREYQVLRLRYGLS